MVRRLTASFLLMACALAALFVLARVVAFNPWVDGVRPLTAIQVSLLVMLVGASMALWLARSLSKPFRQLAVAADDLARGRFDVKIPTSRVPEAREIGAALAGAARSQELRLREQKVFLEQTSHVIRTPLTGIRLELEDLMLRSDDPEVRETAQRCVDQVESLDHDAGRVLDWARDWIGAGQPLADLAAVARHVTQRWNSRAVSRDIGFRSFLYGETGVQVVPGLVEQVLDQILDVAVEHVRGSLRLTFTGLEHAVRVDVLAEGPAPEGDPRLEHSRTLAEALGGSMSGDLFSATGLSLLLPGR